MTAKVEMRTMEIRAEAGDEFALVGRAVKYNAISSSELMRGVRERIRPGAFRQSLASGRDVKALLNHSNSGLPLGRLANGTLKLTDSEDGLYIRCQLERDNSTHSDVFASVKRGDISEMSFAFACDEDDVSTDTYEGEVCQVRNVKKAQLYDVSVVTAPFYGSDATAVAARTASAAEVEARRKWLTDHLADAQRRERAHEIGMSLLRDLKIAE
jgi:HK97 family phage prohead protease